MNRGITMNRESLGIGITRNRDHYECESLGIGVAVNWDRLDFVTLTYSSRRNHYEEGITINRESLGIGVAVNWDRLDFVTLTYSSRRKPKRKRPAR